MTLTKKVFDDFVDRLIHHNKGKGVEYHYTSHPIFLVQKRTRIYGFDSEYSNQYFWCRADRDNGEYEADERTTKRLDALYEDGRDIKNWERIYYIDRWEYVNAHFTKEGALEFIKRKQHDYDELRVYVDSQYWCHEFNSIISALIEGKIVYKGE